MPTTCVAYGCSSQCIKGSGLGFFRFPSASRDRPRREAWINAVRRQDDHGGPWEPSSTSRLCGNHFVTGRPWLSPRHPDFVPTLFTFSSNKAKRTSALSRFQRATERTAQKKPPEQGSTPSGSLAFAVQDGGDDMDVDGVSDSEDLHDTQSQQHPDHGVASTPSIRGQNEDDAVDGLLLLQCRRAPETGDMNDTEVSEESCPSSSSKVLQENLALRKEIKMWKMKCRKLERRILSMDNIDPTSFKFYTGLANRKQFDALYSHVANNANVMQYWDCAEKKSKGNGHNEHGEKQLTKKEELFMVLYRLRTGTCAKEIARNFGVSESTVSRTFCTWVNFLDKELTSMNSFPTLQQVKDYMPEAFRPFPETRVVLDCTEVRIQKPSRLSAQKQTFSSYKHYNTFKALIGVTPDGYVSFMPDLWGGHVSDTEIVVTSGLLDLLQPGDGVMADKGFRLESSLPAGVKLYMPPFKRAPQFSVEEVRATRKVASARIHVERVIRRIKEFHFFDKPIPINMLDIASSLFRVCAFLCNLQPPIMEVRQ